MTSWPSNGEKSQMTIDISPNEGHSLVTLDLLPAHYILVVTYLHKRIFPH